MRRSLPVSSGFKGGERMVDLRFTNPCLEKDRYRLQQHGDTPHNSTYAGYKKKNQPSLVEIRRYISLSFSLSLFYLISLFLTLSISLSSRSVSLLSWQLFPGFNGDANNWGCFGLDAIETPFSLSRDIKSFMQYIWLWCKTYSYTAEPGENICLPLGPSQPTGSY